MQALLPRPARAPRRHHRRAGCRQIDLHRRAGRLPHRRGHKVAVLAVDPSSRRTGGSILADKTRMARLADDPNAFIRPSPSAGTLGGVAAKTRETMLLCEAAGYDVILVETVGIGQSETSVADMTDFFLALMLPGAGDELQGLKKGLIELADMIAINKADGDNVAGRKPRRRNTARRCIFSRRASPHWQPPVVTYSALTGAGLARSGSASSTTAERLVGGRRPCGAAGRAAGEVDVGAARGPAARALRPTPRLRPSLPQWGPRSPTAAVSRRSPSRKLSRCWAVTPMRTILTGFGRFPGSPVNPSGFGPRLARRRRPASPARRIAHVFATAYDAVDRDLPSLLARSPTSW